MRTTAFPYIQAREIDYFAQAAAILESIVPNARHALGYGDGDEAAATIESRACNARYTLGDDCRGATYYQGIAACFNDCIAAIARIIFRIPLCHYYGGEVAAIIVFASCFVSVICVLNDRKVITLIL